MSNHAPRMIEREIQSCLQDHPILLLTGPRACGKTTTASSVARDAVRLDIRSDAALFHADPVAALDAFPRRPLLIDEWQEVPDVMRALKRAVDDHAPPGSFILTGSSRPRADVAWPSTGRIIDLCMSPLAVREIRGGGSSPGLLSDLLGGGLPQGASGSEDIGDYIDLALAGGFPHPSLQLGAAARGRWYRAYADQICSRDTLAALARVDPARIRRFFAAYALNSGGLVEDRTLYEAAGINRKTAQAYTAVLEGLFVIAAIPAWSSNRLKQLIRSPKKLVIDAGLMAGAAGFGRDDVIRDGGLLGRLLETFVYAQMAPEVAAWHPNVRIHHFRTEGGRQEIDFILDLGGGRLFAVEVKATSAPDQHDARHLAWLRDRLGEDFIGGAVFHTGGHRYPLGDRLVALPISAFWAN